VIDDFGGDETIAHRDLKPDNVIPFPGLRHNEKLAKAWSDEVDRANKEAKTKLRLISPLQAMADLERQRKLPTLPWPTDWAELGKRARTYAGQCIGIVGPTGGGKTSFALQIAIAAGSHGIPVLWNPKELDAPEIDIRLAANMVGQHTHLIRDTWAAERFAHHLAAVDDVWRYVDNVRDLEAQIEAYRIAIRIAKRVYRRAPLLVVDYIGKFGAGARDPRLAIMNAAESIRDLIMTEEAYCALLAQPSRGNNEMLTGRKDIVSAADSIGAAGESSEIEHACANMLNLNVFKEDDADHLDAHVLVTKARNTGKEGRQGYRFNKPGGVWKELDYLPATPGEIEVKHKQASGRAKKEKNDPPTKASVRAEINVERADQENHNRKNRIVGTLKGAGIHGMQLGKLKTSAGVGKGLAFDSSLQELVRSGDIENLRGTSLWRWIPR
jgi:KaiC/GvpD/RAD55 family RecA-like ATPase